MVNQVNCTFENGNVPRCNNDNEDAMQKVGSFRDGGASSKSYLKFMQEKCLEMRIIEKK